MNAAAVAASMRGKFRHLPGPGPRTLLEFQFDNDAKHRTNSLRLIWPSRYGKFLQFGFANKKTAVLSSVDLLQKAFSHDELNDRLPNFYRTYILGNNDLAFSKCSEDTWKLRHLLWKTLYENHELCEVYNRAWKSALSEFVATSKKCSVCFNVNDLLRKTTEDYFSLVLTGRSFPEEDEGHSCIWEFIDLLYQMMDPSVDGPLRMFPFLRFLPGKFGNLFRQTTAARDKVAKKYFEEQKATYDHGQIRGLVDVCLKTQRDEIDANGTTWLTDEYIKGLIYDTLGAGMTEMLKTLRLFLLLMTQNQNCQAKMRLEVDDVVGRHEFPSLSKRSQMPYSQAVILETLRYISQTPFAIPHRCSKDVELDGYLIEKDTVILPNLWGIHHDEEIWGDPWDFRPERFLDDSGQLLPQDHIYMQTLIPFSVGRRQCPGQDFAKSRLFLCLTYLVQQLIILPAEGAPMPSTDPREYTSKYPMYHPQFECRLLPRDSL